MEEANQTPVDSKDSTHEEQGEEGEEEEEEEQEEEEGDSPVECSSGETKQLAFIPGEVSRPVPSRDGEEKVTFLHRSRRGGAGAAAGAAAGARAQKASAAGKRWRQPAEDGGLAAAPRARWRYLEVGVAWSSSALPRPGPDRK